MEKEQIILKKDVTANWRKAINFVPKEGEIILYEDIPKPNNFKIGDGKTKVNDLPFLNIYNYSIDKTTFIIEERK